MAFPPNLKFSTFADGGQLTNGDIIVGLRNGADTRFTFSGSASGAYIVPPVTDGHFVIFDGTSGGLQDLNIQPSDPTKDYVVMANAPVTIGRIAVYSDVNGTVSEDAATAINAGNIQAGFDGTAGFLSTFPATLSTGRLIVQAIENAGDYTVTIKNASHGQVTNLTIPDGGVVSSSFILTNSASTQTIATGSLALTSGNITANNGVITAGNSAGSTYNSFSSFSPTAAKGSLTINCSNNAANYALSITNASMGQATAFTIPDPGAASASFLLSSSSGTIHITSGNFQVDNGNIIAGSNGSAGYFQSYPSAVTSGTFKLAAVNNSGAFDVTISNASHTQSSIVSIPDGGQATSNFIISNSAGTQTIATGSLALTNGSITLTSGNLNITSGNVAVTTGNIQTSDGNVIAGKTTGSTNNSIISYTPTTTLGNLTIKSANNVGNFTILVTNASHGQATTLTIPDGAASASNFIISNSATAQTIATGGLTLTAGNIIASAGFIQASNNQVRAGSDGGCTDNQFISFSLTTLSGQLRLKCADNAGNFLITIANASYGQATNLTIPDPASSTANFILSKSASTQTISTGNLTLSAGDFTITSGNIIVSSGSLTTSGNIQSNNGNIIAGATTGSTNNSVISYTPTSTLGNLTVKAANNVGNFTVLVTNTSHGQNSTYSIPDGGVASSNFIISNSTGTQTIATGNLTMSSGTFTITSGNVTVSSGTITASGNIQSTNGNVIAGDTSGSTNNSVISYTPTTILGSLRLQSANNAGNFTVTIKNSSHAQTTTLTIPDGGNAASNFIISNSSGTQTIATGSLTLSSGSITLTSGNLNITSGNIAVTTGNIQTSDGNVIAGKTTGSTNNSFISYTPTTTLGSLRLKAVNNSGNFDITVSNASHGQTTTLTIPDGGVSASNFIITNSTGAQTIATGGLTLTAGNMIVSAGFIQASNNNVRAGKSGGCTDNQFISFSLTAAMGQFRFLCTDNSADILVKVTNASHAQNSTYSIPDSGATTANLIISKYSGTQNIDTGSLQLTAGSLFIGTSAGGGTNGINIYPSGANKGYLQFIAQNNTADYFVSIKNAAHGQNTIYAIADAGVASGTILTCALGAVNPQTNMFYKTFSGSITRAALAAGGTVTLLSTTGSATYTILEIFIASGTNFSGGGGNRNIEIYETTTGASYSIIPAATVQALSNQRWGTTAVPYPASISVMSTFGSGNSLSARYNGGTTDYSTAGDLALGILFARTA